MIEPTNWTALQKEHPPEGHDGERRAPVLSIVIPAFNVAPFIEDAVASALGQSFGDLEVIVIDDGSTDATPDKLRALAIRRADPRLRIVRQDNAGLSAARNAGLARARGEFIGFLDGDDIWLPQKAARQIAAMRADPSIGLSFSHSEYLTESGARTGAILLAGEASPSLHDLIRRNHLGNGSTVIARRACFEEAGVFRAELRSCEDYEMWCRILWMTRYRAALTPEPLTLYRLRESSLSFNSQKFVENADRAMACLRAAMPNLPQRVLRAGHAEHYRIAAWKAVSSGRHLEALSLMARALALRPLLLATDWRALGTAVAIVSPPRLRDWLAASAKSLQKSYYKIDSIAGA